MCQGTKNIHGTRVGYNLENREVTYLGVISRGIMDKRAERTLSGGKKGILRIYRIETVDTSRSSRVKLDKDLRKYFLEWTQVGFKKDETSFLSLTERQNH